MLFELSLLNAKLPESNSRCGRHVQRIYTVRHGDTNHIVGSRNRFVRKTISLSTHHNSQPGLGLQTGLSMEMELSVSAMAAVRKPNSPSVSRGPSIHVHGTRKPFPLKPGPHDGSEDRRNYASTAQHPCQELPPNGRWPQYWWYPPPVDNHNTPGSPADVLHTLRNRTAHGTKNTTCQT